MEFCLEISFSSLIGFLIANPRSFQDSTWFTEDLVLITFMGHWYYFSLVIIVTILNPGPLGDLLRTLFTVSGILYNFACAVTLSTEALADEDYGSTTLEGFMIVLITVASVNCVLLCFDLIYTWKELAKMPMVEDFRIMDLQLHAEEDSISIVSDYTAP